MGNELEKVEMTLGGEINLSFQLFPETLKRIQDRVAINVTEKQALERLGISANKIEACYNLLFERMPSGTKTPAAELLALAETTKLSLLIFKLNKFVASRGDIWELKKGTVGGKTAYSLISKS
jgi:hypothetical protein